MLVFASPALAQTSRLCPYSAPMPPASPVCPALGPDGTWGQTLIPAGDGRPAAVVLYGPGVASHLQGSFSWSQGGDPARGWAIELDANRQRLIDHLLLMHRLCTNAAMAPRACISLPQAYRAWAVALEQTEPAGEQRYPWDLRRIGRGDWRYTLLHSALTHRRTDPSWLTAAQIEEIVGITGEGPVGAGFAWRADCGDGAPGISVGLCEFALPGEAQP